MAKQNKALPRVFARDRAKQLVECRNRQPLPGERIHADLSQDAKAVATLTDIAWLVESMVELLSAECPQDLTKTKYFAALQRHHSDPGYILARIRKHQQLAREMQLTGYESCGWPVIWEDASGIRMMNGRHRLAIQIALGRAPSAIIQGERAKPAHS